MEPGENTQVAEGDILFIHSQRIKVEGNRVQYDYDQRVDPEVKRRARAELETLDETISFMRMFLATQGESDNGVSARLYELFNEGAQQRRNQILRHFQERVTGETTETDSVFPSLEDLFLINPETNGIVLNLSHFLPEVHEEDQESTVSVNPEQLVQMLEYGGEENGSGNENEVGVDNSSDDDDASDVWLSDNESEGMDQEIKAQLEQLFSDGETTFLIAQPLTPLRPYFEVKIIDLGLEPGNVTAEAGCVAIGLASKSYALDEQLPGWREKSVAMHSDDGSLFCSCGTGSPFCFPSGIGDVLGCGADFDTTGAFKCLFFTKNGQLVGTTQYLTSLDDLYPAVGLDRPGAVVEVFCGGPYPPGRWTRRALDEGLGGKLQQLGFNIHTIRTLQGQFEQSLSDGLTLESLGEAVLQFHAEERSDDSPVAEENSDGPDAELFGCVVCMDEEADSLYLPCGHIATCRSCTQKITICPICRTAISLALPIARVRSAYRASLRHPTEPDPPLCRHCGLPASTIALPCAHFSLCQKCAGKLLEASGKSEEQTPDSSTSSPPGRSPPTSSPTSKSTPSSPTDKSAPESWDCPVCGHSCAAFVNTYIL